eukprot:m.39300 g.39300  ORF g.39300 m.39300 type:complete len:601 (-) comp9533_c0_seq1:138-1940(-)
MLLCENSTQKYRICVLGLATFVAFVLITRQDTSFNEWSHVIRGRRSHALLWPEDVQCSWPPTQFRTYVLDDNTAVITWVASTAVHPQILCAGRNSGSCDQSVKATPKPVVTGKYGIDNGRSTVWSASIKMDVSSFFYSVQSDKRAPSQEYTLTIPPVNYEAVPDQGATVGVVGDMGRYWSAPFTRKGLMDDTLDALIIPGDVAYGNGDTKKWNSYMQGMQPIFTRMPLYTCPGNHETIDEWNAFEDAMASAYDQRLGPVEAAERSKSPSVFYYSFRLAGIHFASVCVEGECRKKENADKQAKWLHEDLKKAAKLRKNRPDYIRWIVIIQHRCHYCTTLAERCHTTANHGIDKFFKVLFEPIYKRHGVDLVISGHDHVYERTFNVYKEKRDHEGPIHIQVGTGGHNVKEEYKCFVDSELTAYKASKTGYGRLRVDQQAHSLTFEMVLVNTEGCPSTARDCSVNFFVQNPDWKVKLTVADSVTLYTREKQSVSLPPTSVKPTLPTTKTMKRLDTSTVDITEPTTTSEITKTVSLEPKTLPQALTTEDEGLTDKSTKEFTTARQRIQKVKQITRKRTGINAFLVYVGLFMTFAIVIVVSRSSC